MQGIKGVKGIDELDRFCDENDLDIVVHAGRLCGFKPRHWRE